MNASMEITSEKAERVKTIAKSVKADCLHRRR